MLLIVSLCDRQRYMRLSAWRLNRFLMLRRCFPVGALVVGRPTAAGMIDCTFICSRAKQWLASES